MGGRGGALGDFRAEVVEEEAATIPFGNKSRNVVLVDLAMVKDAPALLRTTE
jgi:hypothetical protein